MEKTFRVEVGLPIGKFAGGDPKGCREAIMLFDDIKPIAETRNNSRINPVY